MTPNAGDRPFVTIVTSDLKGSTALGERLDPESLREVLTLYFDEMVAIFEGHGGTIVKIIGDAIVAVFGLPVPAEDDALHALQAAAESQRGLASLNEVLDQRWGLQLVVRTGVASGEVNVGEDREGQQVLTGDVMTIATAMEQNAPPLEVLVAESTIRIVGASAETEPAGQVTPKGSELVVVSHRLVSVETPEAADDDRAIGRSSTSARNVTERRKTVTIVFADPRPTPIDGRPLDPRSLGQVMARYFESMRVALERHGGTVEKFIGDAVMAVYGLPVRHEDDALRAIRASVAMQAAMPDLNARFREEFGIELRNHIGVNTGEVITGDAELGQRLVTGDAVNTAARLEQAAGPHEIVVGELTHRLARDHVETEPIEPLTLKGKAEPVPAFRLIRIRETAPEPGASSTPFVGRDEELDRLEMLLLEVGATRSCELMTVIGDAGVGKSRLIREFAHRAAARERTQILRGRCLPYGDGVTFWPITEMVRHAAAIDDDDAPEVAIDKIASIARHAAGRTEDQAGIADRVGAAMGLSATPYPVAEIFWGIRKLLEAIASRRPLVAIVDDLDAAAPTFLDLLDHLIDAVHGAPILLLTTARHELLETRAEWAEAHLDERLVLEPLSADDADRILDGLLRGLDSIVRARIIAAAEGNPLYVEQITSMLVETGAVRRVGDEWSSDAAPDQIEIPPTVHALVAARLDALRSEERQVVDPASVIGLGFPVEAVARLLPEDVAPQVGDRLASLTGKQLVRPSTDDPELYRFGHSVIKDTAYGSLLKRTRAEWHERFVAWAEPVNRERGRELEFEEILGFHLEQAYHYQSELGSVDPSVEELGRRAAAKLASAGRRAFGRGDAPAAAGLLRRATDVLPTLDPVRIELLTELAEAEIEQGRFDAAAQAQNDAAAGATTIDDARLAARATLIAYQLSFITTGSAGDPDRRLGDVKEMIRMFEGAGDQSGLARAWREIWIVQGNAGALEAAAEAASQVADIATRMGDSRLAARSAIAYSQAALESPMPVSEAIQRCRALLDAVRRDRIAEARFLPILGVLYAMDGDIDEARRLDARSREIIADLGRSITVAATSQETSRIELLAGDPASAERDLRRDYATLEAAGETYTRSTIAGLLAHVLLERGSPEEALHFVSVAVDLAGEDDVFSQVLWRSAKARALARSGQSVAAMELAREAIAQASAGAYLELEADARLHFAEVLGRSGRHDDERRLLEESGALYEKKGDRTMLALVRSRLDTLT